LRTRPAFPLVDLAVPLRAGDALSARIAWIVGGVMLWLFRRWELRARVVPAVSDGLVSLLTDLVARATCSSRRSRRPSASSCRGCSSPGSSARVVSAVSDKLVNLLADLVARSSRRSLASS
jgi:hypothetical protein